MSTDMKHTPGPWRVSLNTATGAFAIEDDNRIAVICSRADWIHRASESAANARLIAAAPDLLAALMWLVEHPACQASYSADSEMARRVDRAVTAILLAGVILPDEWPPAAIAKATGSPSTERDGGEAKRSTPENRT